MEPLFQVGRRYTRADVYDALGFQPHPMGGEWTTGYVRHWDDWFIFANVGVPGRTGHDYANRWVGNDLLWEGKAHRRVGQPSTQNLLYGPGVRHVFTRTEDREPFTYEGVAVAHEVQDSQPFRVLWRFLEQPRRRAEVLAEELVPQSGYWEGAARQVQINVYERDPAARSACLAAHGTRCAACDTDMGEVYGELGAGFIHVHHLRPLSEVGQGYQVDPVADLCPLCPNCHAIVHRVSPPLKVPALQQMLQAAKRKRTG